MIRYATPLVLVLGFAVFGLFQLKDRVLDTHADLLRVHGEIAVERGLIKQLDADLAFLTRPERIAAQAGQLGMVPGTVERVVALDEVGRRRAVELAGERVPVLLSSGEAVELRFKPLGLIGAGSQADR